MRISQASVRLLLLVLALSLTGCQPFPPVMASSGRQPESVAQVAVAAAPTTTAATRVPTSTRSATPVRVRPTATPTQLPSPTPTATEVPPTPSPTATPAPTAAPLIYFTANKTVNIRKGPGTNYDIAGKISPGESHDIIGTNPTREWLQFMNGESRGWVAANVVVVSGDLITVQTAQDIPQPPPPAPNRIVAPAIRLDAKVVPIGWREAKTVSGTVLEWEVAAYAAGWHKNSARPGEAGNTVISGHHNIEGEVFRYVVDLKVGDQVTVYVGSQQFNYRVVDRMILPDKYVSYQQRLDNAKWIGPFDDERLTLVTCWPYNNNTHRVIVVAKPVS